MNGTSMLESKLSNIRSKCAPFVGTRITHFETAEILHLDGKWAPWPDLPIRVFTATSGLISISWSRFDDLWLSTDLSIPFEPEDTSVRWVVNAIDVISPAIGGTIEAIHLGRGQMSIEGTDVEIWTRIVIETDKGWIEVFNALDENGYDFHSAMPSGEFVPCV
jgi:hypothetical protein